MAIKLANLQAKVTLRGQSELNDHITEERIINAGESVVKVHSVDGTKSQAVATVTFTSGDKLFSRKYEFTPSVEDVAPNYIKQAYEHLKTLPEFYNCQDC